MADTSRPVPKIGAPTVKGKKGTISNTAPSPVPKTSAKQPRTWKKRTDEDPVYTLNDKRVDVNKIRSMRPTAKNISQSSSPRLIVEDRDSSVSDRSTRSSISIELIDSTDLGTPVQTDTREQTGNDTNVNASTARVRRQPVPKNEEDSRTVNQPRSRDDRSRRSRDDRSRRSRDDRSDRSGERQVSRRSDERSEEQRQRRDDRSDRSRDDSVRESRAVERVSSRTIEQIVTPTRRSTVSPSIHDPIQPDLVVVGNRRSSERRVSRRSSDDRSRRNRERRVSRRSSRRSRERSRDDRSRRSRERQVSRRSRDSRKRSISRSRSVSRSSSSSRYSSRSTATDSEEIYESSESSESSEERSDEQHKRRDERRDEQRSDERSEEQRQRRDEQRKRDERNERRNSVSKQRRTAKKRLTSTKSSRRDYGRSSRRDYNDSSRRKGYNDSSRRKGYNDSSRRKDYNDSSRDYSNSEDSSYSEDSTDSYEEYSTDESEESIVTTESDGTHNNVSIDSLEDELRQKYVKKVPVKLKEDIDFRRFKRNRKVLIRLWNEVRAKYYALFDRSKQLYQIEPIVSNMFYADTSQLTTGEIIAYLNELYVAYRELKTKVDNEFTYLLIKKVLILMYKLICFGIDYLWDYNTGRILNVILSNMDVHDALIRQIKFGESTGPGFSVTSIPIGIRILAFFILNVVIIFVFAKAAKISSIVSKLSSFSDKLASNISNTAGGYAAGAQVSIADCLGEFMSIANLFSQPAQQPPPQYGQVQHGQTPQYGQAQQPPPQYGNPPPQYNQSHPGSQIKVSHTVNMNDIEDE